MSAISPPAMPSNDQGQRQTAFSSLRHRDFRLLWLGQIISVTGSQMQLVAINGIPASAVGHVLPRLSTTSERSPEKGKVSNPIAKPFQACGDCQV